MLQSVATSRNQKSNPSMKTTYRILAPSTALLMSAASVFAQTTTTPPDTHPMPMPSATHPTPPTTRPNANASDSAKAVHTLLDQFKAQRDQFLATRQALVERLKTATSEERKTILDQLRADQQARVDEQRALGKQIRDELKNLHREKTGGR